MAEFKLNVTQGTQDYLSVVYGNNAEAVENVNATKMAKIPTQNIMFSNQLSQTLNLTFGGTQSIDIPASIGYLRNVIMKFTLNVATAASGVDADYMAHNMIKEVSWGLLNTERIYRRNLVAEQLLQCGSSEEKKQKLLELSGRAGATILPVANDQTFYAMLPLPWNSVAKHKPGAFPLYLLSREPFRLDITLAQKADVFTAGTINNVTLAKCEVLYEYGKLPSQEAYLLPTDSQPIQYPFKYHMDQTFSVANASTELSLTGFRNAQVQYIIVERCDVGNQHRYRGERLTNLSLTLAGQVIWQASNRDHEMWSLVYDDQVHTHNKNIILANAGNAGVDNIRVYGADTGDAQIIREGFNRNYIYVIPIAEILEKNVHDFRVGLNADRESLKLGFDNPGASTFHVTYVYNACYSFTKNNGLNLIF